MKVWYCKIGEAPGDLLPDGADQVMRAAVEDAYFDLAGNNEFIFSGWGAKLTEGERAVVEDREPDQRKILAEAFAQLPADVRRLLTCALAGNHPEHLAHLRHDVILGLAKADAEAGVL